MTVSRRRKSSLRDLHNESNVALISPRRLGKSGLIQHVFDAMRTREPESVCIYIDILHTKNQTEFAELFFSRVIAAMDSNAQTALRKAAQFFKGIRPTMSFDEFNGSPSFSIDIQPSQEQSTIEQTFDYIAKSGKRCYIAFDEFQQITEYPEKGDGGVAPFHDSVCSQRMVYILRQPATSYD